MQAVKAPKTPKEGIKGLLFVKGQSYHGNFQLKGQHLLFQSSGGNVRLSVHTIWKVATDGEKKLEVQCANFKYFFFLFPAGGCRAIADAIERKQKSKPLCVKSPVNVNSAGWSLYSHEDEYLRVFGAELGTEKSLFRITAANASYQLCASYPFLMVVPTEITDETLQACAKYRSSSRFPGLTWRHPTNGATLSRCAQPLIGLNMSGGERSPADETVINSLRVSGSMKDGLRQQLFIVDARPLLNAHANKMTGGGTENMAWYRSCVLEQLDLVNIHKVRDSFDALHTLMVGACKVESGYSEGLNPHQTDDGRWLAALHESRWPGYVSMILKGAMRIASLLRDGNPVLVHCSDGWDRTPQVCALAQLVLDPYFRTRHGMAVLISKEWISFGHRFATRTGQSTHRETKEYCPVFLQWIDCVYQIARKFPTAFDFNSHFLIALVDHLYATDTATFSYDTEREATQNFTCHDGSPSLWDTLVLAENSAKKYGNPSFKPTQTLLFVKPFSWNYQFFDKLFMRF